MIWINKRIYFQGIHFGPILAGVIGYHKPQFSLIGDTVNTTSRVCSNGANGKITLSEKAFSQIKKELYEKIFFVPHEIEAKGKGKILTFVLENCTSSSFERSVSNQIKIKNHKNNVFRIPSNHSVIIKKNNDGNETTNFRARGKSVFIIHSFIPQFF